MEAVATEGRAFDGPGMSLHKPIQREKQSETYGVLRPEIWCLCFAFAAAFNTPESAEGDAVHQHILADGGGLS